MEEEEEADDDWPAPDLPSRAPDKPRPRSDDDDEQRTSGGADGSDNQGEEEEE
jgi:hypothetical protein